MRKSYIFYLVVVILFFSSCATNPVTGQPQLMLISEAQEINMGKKANKDIIKEYGIYKLKGLNSYVSDIGFKLVKYVQRKELKYHFTVLDSPVVNAFAVPGGYVYITRGILAYINNEAQLASILGHELGHINARHSVSMISKQILFNLGVGVAYIVSKDFRKYAGIIALGGNLLFLKFSRNDEYQADSLGVEYATLAGYNTFEMAKFFKVLERIEKKEGYSLPEWFSTHPSPPHRIEKVKYLTKKWQRRAGYRRYLINKYNYLIHINGLLFGKDKRNGYVEKNHYYHPNLRFKFDFPKGWKLVDTKQYILITSNKYSNVQILITLTNKELKRAVSEFLKKDNGKLLDYRETTINGNRAVVILKNAKIDGKYYTIKTFFIEYNGHTFILNAKAPLLSYLIFSKQISMPAETFKKLKSPSKINVKNKYIKIVKVNRDIILKNFLISLNVKKKYFKTIALLNGLDLNSVIKKNDYIKIIIEK